MKKLLGIFILFFIGVNAIVSYGNDGNLCYYPESHDFGYMQPGETASTTFEICACCGCTGTISYTLIENCSWLDVHPKKGTSSGERDVITVYVNTTGLSEGSYVYPIKIESNAGEGVFTVSLKVVNDDEPPLVDIVEPQRGWLYLYGEKKFMVGFTVMMGEGRIEVKAVDNKTEIEKVEIYIGNELVKTDTIEPYVYLWTEPAFGLYVVKAVAYDIFSNVAMDRIIVWKFL